jgi:DNA-binding NarL/FixJ family response regulator
MAERKKVLIVDDHPVVRRGLAVLIKAASDLEVCGEAEDLNGALRAIEETRPDIVLVDISLKRSDGIQLIRQMASLHPRVPALTVSMHDESVYAERALRAGARGYITKQAAEDHILEAMHRVLEGKVYLSEDASERLKQRFVGKLGGEPGSGTDDSSGPAAGRSPVELLSDREFEVFCLIGRGLRIGQIADRLFLSVKTAETYQGHIKDKLNLRTAWQLSEYAVAWTKAHMDP